MNKIFFSIVLLSFVLLSITALPLNAFAVDACCLPNGSCVEEEAGPCAADSGIFHPGTLCSEIICRPTTTVPTMTQWGMIIFVLLAGLGAVYHLRRQKRAGR